MKEKVKGKLVMMVILLGLIVGANDVFSSHNSFLYAFDTMSFATMIVLLFGIRRDVGSASTPELRRGIFFMLIVVVGALTLVMVQFYPRPFSYFFGVFGVALMAYMYYAGYRVAETESKTVVKTQMDV